MRQTQKPVIVWDKVAYKCTFPIFFKNKQHKGFLEILKKSIPSSERDYNPTTHEWFIQEKWLDIVVQLTTLVFGEPYVARKEEWNNFQYSSTVIPTHTDLKKFDSILRDAAIITNGTDVAKLERNDAVKLYRKAALILHPDKNPANAAIMSQLNEVFTRLKQTYYKDAENNKV